MRIKKKTISGSPYLFCVVCKLYHIAQYSSYFCVNLISLHLFQDPETEDPVEVPSTYRKKGPISLTQQLKELDRLVLANQEEDLACSFKLNSLLEIIED